MDKLEFHSQIIEKHEDFDLLAFEGKLSKANFFYGREYRPRKKPQATLLYLHDLGDHVGRQNDFFKAFVSSYKRSVQVLMYDYRGHGKSSGNRGHIESIDDLCFDGIQLLEHFKEDIGSRPVYILCSGIGSLVALKTLSEFFSRLSVKVSGLILLNPSFKWRGALPQFRDLIFSKGSFLGKVKVPFYLEGSDISSDPLLAQEFDRDPLVNHRFSWNTFWEFKRNSSLLRTSAYYLNIPIFIGISRRDKVYDYKITELFSRAINDSTIQFYEVSDHDLLHSHITSDLIRDVSQWLDLKFSSLKKAKKSD
ncbi:MAG: hypothetical protein CME63_04015 [Halobacteriovoraceae bacterium]|nr:hypothetical protein [Halobacteriovoraceae bacterium]|tara:strand:- start:192596 stop:193519 length:924 start_codon:yes stop_codon:yes gene_type:complete